ncbi:MULTISPECIES: TolC family protein [unclassified Oceanispirochaeta]|uniref:TolC family protein n=1 Tax=unclassified Oceanispirochaeta TaxID=2635722 RepID=UPI000E093438|nr:MULTISPECIES: TolC family protein [unclassified Oceanispirochaeta]MBF9018360.1 TolC family protein [Oceanispirochaeta sp. M2]NPD74836.1 TolC family protein [Oceanispirochaeta sp. M1]RDG29329.1 TolC family protein [Oceanispirochaeta sp. M1]
MKKTATLLLLSILSFSSLQAQGLDLDDYLQLIEKNSKDLYMARLDQDLAANKENQVRAANRPMVQGQAGYNRNFLEIEQPMPAYADGTADSAAIGIYPIAYEPVRYNSDNEFSLSVGVQQNLFDMKITKALKASQKYQDLTGSIYEASRQGILTAGKKVYYQTILLDEVYKVKKSTEDNAYETYLDIKKRYENDLASELEVLQAEVNWQINIPDSSQAARNRDLAMSNLKHLGGIDPDEKLILTGSLSSFPEIPTETELGSILSTRPDYNILINQRELNDINISMVRAEFYPTLAASAGYGWQKHTNDFDLEDGIGALQAGLQLTIPIFYGGSRFSKLEEAKLELDKTRMSILKKQDDVQTEINNLRLLLEESSSRIEVAQTTLKIAKKAYGIMEISSRNGLATQLDLKDALLNLDGAQLNYYKAIYDYLEAYFNYQQAVGEGGLLFP